MPVKGSDDSEQQSSVRGTIRRCDTFTSNKNSEDDVILNVREVVAPVDVETILSQRRSSGIYSYSPKSPQRLSEVPSDDTEVRTLRRDHLNPLLNNAKHVVNHVRDFITHYNDDFVIVAKKYQMFNAENTMTRWKVERHSVFKNLRPQVFADPVQERVKSITSDNQEDGSSLSLSRAVSSSESNTVGNYLQRPIDKNSLLSGLLQKNRLNHLMNCVPDEKMIDRLPARESPPIPEDVVKQKLFVKICKANIEPCVEPLFGSMAIYENKGRRKITETFYFDVVANGKEALLANFDYSPLNKCMSTMFQLSSTINDLFLVIKLDKVLQQGDPLDATEPYTSPRDNTYVEKLQQSAENNCKRLGNYRMPFGIQVIDLKRVFSYSAQQNKSDVMCASSCTIPGGITIHASNTSQDDRASIASADRISTATTTSTLRRYGSGTSAATVFNRMRTPLTKKKLFTKVEESVDSKDVPDLIDNLPLNTLHLSTFIRQDERCSDEEIHKMITEMSNNHKGKIARKSFNVDFEIIISGSNKAPEVKNLRNSLDQPDRQNTNDSIEINEQGFMLYNSYRNLLFVYPRQFNLSGRSGNARNISIKVELMDMNEAPVQSIFVHGSTLEGPFTKSAHTTVIYHQKIASIGDEIKILLPADLNDGHHLLFTFYHISCKENEGPPQVPVGYAWIPLYIGSMVRSGDFNLPILSEKPPDRYFYLDSDKALPNFKWIDAQKPIFQVNLKVLTSVHPQDTQLLNFFQAVSSLSSHTPVSQTDLSNSLTQLIKGDPVRLGAFSHVVMSRLLLLIARQPFKGELTPECMKSLSFVAKLCTRVIVQDLDVYDRSMLVASFIAYRKTSSQESSSYFANAVHSSTSLTNAENSLGRVIEDMERSQSRGHLMRNDKLPWVFCEGLSTAVGSLRENIYSNTWFFLELLLKTCNEYLSITGRNFNPRKTRFDEQLQKSIKTMCSKLANEVVYRMPHDSKESQAISTSLAFFCRDAFSIFDRTFIMNIIHEYFDIVSVHMRRLKGPQARKAMSIRLSFTKIVCSYEHFLSLNLPFEGCESNRSSSSSIAVPPPSALSDIVAPIDASASWVLSPAIRSQHYLVGLLLTDLSDCLDFGDPELCGKAISNIKLMLRTHEIDTRVIESNAMTHVANLYKPLVKETLGHVNRFFGQTFSQSDHELYFPIPGAPVKSKVKLDQSQTKSLLFCFFWVLKNVRRSDLRDFIDTLNGANIKLLLNLLNYSMNIFEYKYDGNEDRTEPDNPHPVRWRDSRNYDSTSEISTGESLHHSEAAASCEVYLCIVEILATLVSHLENSEIVRTVLPTAFTILTHGLDLHVSEQVFEVIIYAQIAFLTDYSALIIEQKPELCANWSRLLVYHCSSTNLETIRNTAAVAMYHMLLESFKLYKGLRRAKIFLGTALSACFSVFSNYAATLDDDFMKKSLEFVNALAKEESEFDEDNKAVFTSQVIDVTSTLQRIMQSAVRLRKHANDYEMTIDLMAQIADGYSNNPDLRMAWLTNMAEQHEQQGTICEAAHCYLQAAALCAEYIDERTVRSTLPHIGCATFSSISPHVLEESAMSDSLKANNREDRLQSLQFTENGLIKLMEKTFALLERAQLYELLFPLSEIMLNFAQATKSYGRIAEIHKKLASAAEQIQEPAEFYEKRSDAWFSPLPGDRRCFGTFCRVAFFGKLFGELDGAEFVYKLGSYGKLNEIHNYLLTSFTEQFGKNCVEIIKHSKEVDVSKLNPTRAYLQITFLEVYLEDFEKPSKTTNFERNNQVYRFFYETPYMYPANVKDDSPAYQHKTRTILQVEKSFPYMKTRLRVIEKWTQELGPYEVALDDIQKKIRALRAAIQCGDTKMLSMQLQGVLAPTVHKGPLQVAKVLLFNLAHDQNGKPERDVEDKLRLALKELLFLAKTGTGQMKKTISIDMANYQKNLEDNLKDFTETLMPYVTRNKLEQITYTSAATDL